MTRYLLTALLLLGTAQAQQTIYASLLAGKTQTTKEGYTFTLTEGKWQFMGASLVLGYLPADRHRQWVLDNARLEMKPTPDTSNLHGILAWDVAGATLASVSGRQFVAVVLSADSTELQREEFDGIGRYSRSQRYTNVLVLGLKQPVSYPLIVAVVDRLAQRRYVWRIDRQ